MKDKTNYKHTLAASYLGYITQAAVNNLAPLLFVTFSQEFDITLEKIGLLITVNFCVQILVDILAARFIDNIGYRIPVVAAHLFCAAGFVAMGTLPYLLPSAYAGLLIAVGLTAIGGGLIEVLISPIVESLPGDQKASAMSLLHSFYCWGQVAVVLLSTFFFFTIGIENWEILPILWALLPLFNAVFFSQVPLRHLAEENQVVPLRKLFTVKIFWVFMALMVAAGASELAMSQWSSLFAELGLGVSKTLGDLLGPCAFAVLMGLSRTFYGVKGAKLNLHRTLIFSGAGCLLSYLLAAFGPHPLLSLAGCALCGLFVGIMWPGVFSLAAGHYPQGGTGMFAMLAFAGDIGCGAGPGLVGWISNAIVQGNTGDLPNATASGLKAGLTVSIIFPLLLAAGVLLLRRMTTAEQKV